MRRGEDPKTGSSFSVHEKAAPKDSQLGEGAGILGNSITEMKATY